MYRRDTCDRSLCTVGSYRFTAQTVYLCRLEGPELRGCKDERAKTPGNDGTGGSPTRQARTPTATCRCAPHVCRRNMRLTTQIAKHCRHCANATTAAACNPSAIQGAYVKRATARQSRTILADGVRILFFCERARSALVLKRRPAAVHGVA